MVEFKSYNGEVYKRLHVGAKLEHGDMVDCVGAADLRPIINVGATLSNNHQFRYWRKEETFNPSEHKTMDCSTAQTIEPTLDILPGEEAPPEPEPEPDFTALFTPAFTKFLDGVIDKRVDALLIERLASSVETEVEEQFDRKVDEAVGDALDNMCLEDHFDIGDSVSDCVEDVDFSDYVGDSIERYLDDNLDIAPRVREAIKVIFTEIGDNI